LEASLLLIKKMNFLQMMIFIFRINFDYSKID
jgi:hypothetical protein